MAFIDTGSEVTLIKETALQLVDPERRLHRRASKKVLRGVSGKPVYPEAEVTLSLHMDDSFSIPHTTLVAELDFPGDLLIGMDLLRRVDFSLTAEAGADHGVLMIEGRSVTVVFTDSQSLQVNVVTTTQIPGELPRQADSTHPKTKPEAAVHLAQRTELPPHTGRFLEACISRTGLADGDVMVSPIISDTLAIPYSVTTVKERRCSVWVVNPSNRPLVLRPGMQLGTASPALEIFSINQEPDVTCLTSDTTAGMHRLPVDRCDEDSKEGGMIICDETELEWEDMLTGLETQDDGEYAVLPPSVAVAICEAAEEDGSLTLPDLGHLDEEHQEAITRLIDKYSQLFDGGEESIGLIPGVRHTIDTGDAKPVAVKRGRLPQSTRNTIRQQCDTMLRNGVVEPSNSPWLSPVVLVKKKDGSVRFCSDYRGLNSVTKADSYPLPRMDEMIDELGPMDVFTTLDARSAYWSVEIDPKDRPKTAFSDGYRLLQFCRMSFGLSTAPATFQRTMNLVLSPVLGRHTLCYLDDIIVYSKGFSQHFQDLEETLQLLAAANMKLNMEKCQFAAETINFLGFTISPEGVRPNQDKVQAIVSTPPPRTVREVRRFLGATGFFRKHISAYATVASPLHLLLKKGQKWVWGPDQQQAFTKLKDTLVAAPVLRQPDFSREFELHCDASSIAIGACLMQRDEGETPHAVAYYSRKLRGPETHYPAIDLEALSVVEAVRIFDSYLYGRRFTILTDHRPLVPVFSKRTKSPRMTRYAHDLSFYDFTIRYTEGPTNYVPDFLSRKVAEIILNSKDKEQQMDATTTTTDSLPPQGAKTAITDLSSEHLASEQEKDPKLAELRKYLLDGTIPKKKWPLTLAEFEVKEGVVYRLRPLDDQTLHQLVVPASLKNSALKASHLPPLASHPGIQRTFENARSMFYWANMLNDCKNYVEHCTVCQKSRGSPQAVPMADAPLAKYPLERVSMDIFDLGPSIPVRYGLTIIDQHSRYIQLVPLRNVTAAAVHRAFLDHWLTLFGPPRVIQTDNGVQFTSNLFKELCKMIKTTHHYTIRYHPMANGLVERTNRVVKAALTALVDERPKVWHQFVPELRLQLNSAVHRSTNEQPLYLLTGRHASFPVGLTNQLTCNDNVNLQERMREARDAAVTASQKARQTYGKYYNRGKSGDFLPDLGSLVWYWDHGRHTPLTGRWKGPARVISKLGPVSFEVLDVHTDVRRRAHANHLKPFKSAAELSYSSEESEDESSDAESQC